MTEDSLQLIFQVGQFVVMSGIVLLASWIGWRRRLIRNGAWQFSVLAFVPLNDRGIYQVRSMDNGLTAKICLEDDATRDLINVVLRGWHVPSV